MLPQEAFQEAERQFHWYTNEWRNGRMDLASYRQAINNLRVNDVQGRLWMLQEGSGQWHVWTGSHWEPGVPYRPSAPAAPPPPPAAAPAAPQRLRIGETPRAPADADTSGSGLFAKMLLYWIGTLAFFALIGLALLIFVEDFPPEGLLGVGLAALISIILTTKSLSSSWEGQVVELFQKRVRVSSYDDATDEWENVLYARIRQPSGRLREERAMPDWQVGTYLRKRKGQNYVERVN